MKSENQDLLLQDGYEHLSKKELFEALNYSRQETFKYVNKFLEVEEKWAFINLLLKKLNSIRHKQELCKTICEGFLKLTNSKICYFCLFNQDNNSVEFQKIAHEDNINKHELMKLIDSINSNCCDFLEKAVEIENFYSYFNSVSGKKFIAVPVVYSNTFLGYLMLIKEDNNFYNENFHFINIFPEHIALILENISLYQESEKQNKHKVEFLAGISHEFKTPLNSIIGFAEIIKSKSLKYKYSNSQDKIGDDKSHSEYFKYINNILQSSKHLLSLIEDVIDVSKSQYKSLELNYSKFNPKDEITNVILTLDEMIKEKNLKLNYTLIDIIISADIKRFRQLIYNLVSNAIKFNKQNGKISIITYVKDEKFFFEITDTGDGISKRDYEKIFNFFSQVNRSQLKRQSGSGIGLALCKEIMDAHGGEISFKSQFKKGSTFWFSLAINS